MHTKDFEECLRRACELAMDQFAKWQDLITKRRSGSAQHRTAM
jgi:hypothetical protein